MELMKLSRRDFGRGAIGMLGASALGGAALLEGCNSGTVINDINVILQQAAAVLAVVEPNAPWVAEFKLAIAALMTAEQQWQTGGAVQIVIDALNAVVAVTAVIPLTAPYAPLIDILVAGIETVIAVLAPSPSPVVPANVKATRQGNPHVGAYAIPHRAFHSQTSTFKWCWNGKAKELNLPQAVLK